MRKTSHLFLFVFALLAAALWAGTAQAGVPGSAHDTTAGSAGACSACHIPHGGGANRLWPTTAGTGTYVGVVAPLCASCHSNTGGYAGSMGNAASDQYVYHANSHGQLMHVTNLPWSTNVTGATGLPYINQANNFECTTCHDVHNDPAATTPSGFRPFLRVSINDLCQKCHTNRHYVGGVTAQNQAAGAWGGGYVGPTNPGSHPVGSDITGDVYGGPSQINIPVQMRVLTNATGAGGWSLGGHLTANTGGGVTCVTCHAVHGGQIDAQDNTSGQVSFTAYSPNTNYLAIAQASISAAWTNGRSVANGNAGYNFLCEGCHGNNPGGAGTFSHPVDNVASTYDAGVTAFPANWPVGAGGGTNVSPDPICESCHAPHPTADAARADLNNAGGAAYILRDDLIAICSDCHTGTIGGHHPVGMAYNASGVTYLRNTSGGGSVTLTCATCHNGSGGAHNWTAPGAIGMDNNWKPANNGRSTAQATDMFNADMSKTCMDCHYAMDGNAASVSPTLGTGATAAVGLESKFETLNNSMGTHYIGLIHKANTNWKDNTAVNIFSTTQTWRGLLPGYDNSVVAPGWSRFGGDATNSVLVCESCHELEPDKNVGAGANKHLLLARYGEGANGDDGTGDTNGRDVLCEACHGVPPGTHALTGQTVSRTGAALSTSGSWLRGTVLGNATLGTNKLSCDGCHQPHDANTNSYTFILDAPATVAFPSGSQTTVGAGTVDAGQPEATAGYPTANGSAGTYATPTLAGKGGSFTGFCDQCHTYAY